jgi:hydroxymethylpyrimidine/phosphomethylpyrimidine kinase
MDRVYCVTPNLPEATLIWGADDLNTELEQMSEVANIYLKGGHAEGDTVTDMLYTADHTYVFANDRIPNGAKHGSGCVLSAALTAQLAKGNDIAVAAELANAYTHRYLGSTTTLLGIHQRFDA